LNLFDLRAAGCPEIEALKFQETSIAAIENASTHSERILQAKLQGAGTVGINRMKEGTPG
jgi:hypothetical protein